MVREFLAVAARAALQWALATALLANGAAFCLIAAAASWLRLGPPCLLCARVHRLLHGAPGASSSAAGEDCDAFCGLLCDAHAAAVAGFPPSTTGRRRQTCSPPDPAPADGDTEGEMEANDSDKLGGDSINPSSCTGLEAHRVVSIGSEICEQDHGERPRGNDRINVARTSSIDDDDPYVSLFELAPIVEVPQDNPDHVQELGEAPELHLQSEGMPGDGEAAGGEQATVERLAAALRAQRLELEALRVELDGERRARAEAAEYQRQLEEQGAFDREAVRLAMQLVHETETEKHGLQRQLDACRVKAQPYESSMDAAASLSPPCSRPEAKQGANGNDGDGDSNNYQSLVDFLPGSVYSSSPDLANLLKLYTEGNGARRPRDGLTGASAVMVVAEGEEEEEEEEVVVAVTATAVSDTTGDGDALVASIAGASSAESGSNHVERTEAASS